MERHVEWEKGWGRPKWNVKCKLGVFSEPDIASLVAKADLIVGGPTSSGHKSDLIFAST